MWYELQVELKKKWSSAHKYAQDGCQNCTPNPDSDRLFIWRCNSSGRSTCRTSALCSTSPGAQVHAGSMFRCFYVVHKKNCHMHLISRATFFIPIEFFLCRKWLYWSIDDLRCRNFCSFQDGVRTSDFLWIRTTSLKYPSPFKDMSCWFYEISKKFYRIHRISRLLLILSAILRIWPNI